MSTAVDTSALLAIFKAERGFELWLDLLAERAAENRLVACDIVWAEVGSFFSTFDEFHHNMDLLNVSFDPVLPETAHHAGVGFRSYRTQGGPRQHLVPDFLIGAHAEKQASGLVTFDRGFYRRYFTELNVIAPEPPYTSTG